MKRPAILYVAPCWPHARSFGTQIRVLQTARALRSIGDLVLAIIAFPGSEEALEQTSAEFHVGCYGKARGCGRAPVGERVRRSLGQRVVNPHGWMADEAMYQWVHNSLGEFDLIWFNSLRAANSLNRWSWPHSVMDIDDVPSTYERSISRSGDGLAARWRARLNAFVWRRRERLLGERFSVLAVCSEADKAYLNSRGPVHVIPNGFERPQVTPQRKPANPARLGFIGQSDYLPNRQGLEWFASECWPAIKRAQPEVRLRLIGKGTEVLAKSLGPDVQGLGWLSDPGEEISTWSAMIVPVHLGAGTRVKVAEAFSRRCPLVATRLGAFGYDVAHRQELLLADTPEAFSEACLFLVRNPAEAAQITERAWHRFLTEWTWDAIAPRIVAAAEQGLRSAIQRVPA